MTAELSHHTVPSVTVWELKQHIDDGQTVTIIDVREPHEYDTCQIPGARLIPLGTLPSHTDDVPTDHLVVLHCHHGGRSARATEFLAHRGFTNVANLTGGIHAWALEIDPKVATY